MWVTKYVNEKIWEREKKPLMLLEHVDFNGMWYNTQNSRGSIQILTHTDTHVHTRYRCNY